jgi:hypothetical protein
MRSLLVSYLFVVACVVGCNDDNNNNTLKLDMAGGGGSICPAHPENCQGTCCGSKCVATSLDINNCGACNAACTGGTVCMGGKCGCLPSGAPCAMSQTCCPNAGCADLNTDIRNCGMCGRSCGNGSTCQAGVCKCGTATCAATEMCCNGVCSDSCMISMPDMAMSGGMPLCDCSGLMEWDNQQSGGNLYTYCPLTNQCTGNNCCAENEFFPTSGTCTDPTPCQTSDSTFN